MDKNVKRKKWLLFAGLILIALSVAIAVLIFSLRYENLWLWYKGIRDKLMELEDYITGLDYRWQFVGAILLLFILKSFVPIYTTSTVCFIAGAVFGTRYYVIVPLCIIGTALQVTIKYFWGKKFGGGYAWKIVSKNNTLKKLIQSNGKGNPSLLFAMALVPGVPINTVAAIYGSYNFGYRKFLTIFTMGFLPKIIAFSIAGKNMFDPLSVAFLTPVMILSFLTGISCLGANGVWSAVEWVMNWINETDIKLKTAKSKKGNDGND